MAAERRSHRSSSLAVQADQPLIGIVRVEDGQEITRYFAGETETDALVTNDAQTVADARALAGAWSGLDWEEMVEELNHIRHQSVPTPPAPRPPHPHSRPS